jgi:hypothetical protein
MAMETSSRALTEAAAERPTLDVVRYGLIALSTLGLIGAGTELAANSHGLEQLAPWAGLAVLAVATALVALGGRRSVLWARVLCLAVLGAAAYGVAEHLLASASPTAIDKSLSGYWASLSPLTRSWYGAHDLGPRTPLAPGMLGQTALLIVLATLGRRQRATV